MRLLLATVVVCGAVAPLPAPVRLGALALRAIWHRADPDLQVGR